MPLFGSFKRVFACARALFMCLLKLPFLPVFISTAHVQVSEWNVFPVILFTQRNRFYFYRSINLIAIAIIA